MYDVRVAFPDFRVHFVCTYHGNNVNNGLCGLFLRLKMDAMDAVDAYVSRGKS